MYISDCLKPENAGYIALSKSLLIKLEWIFAIVIEYGILNMVYSNRYGAVCHLKLATSVFMPWFKSRLNKIIADLWTT